MQLKKGDIVALSDPKMWYCGECKRSRFIVLGTDCDDADWYLEFEEYVDVFCFDFEEEPINIGQNFTFPLSSLVRIRGCYDGV
jgi:hypothetical protein